ncbi:hypothetical protein GQ457_02G006920 [Hibiscus cannabinus]
MRGAFRSRVWRSGVKWGIFGLGRRSGSEHFRRTGLVIPDMAPTRIGDMRSKGFQQTEGSGSHHVSGVIRDLKRDGDVGLGSQVVNLVGSDGVDPTTKRGSVGEVSIMELHPSLVGVMGVDVDVVNTLRVEVGRAADQAMDFVSFVEKEFSQVRTVLTGDASYQRHLAVGNGRCLAVSGGGSGFGSDTGTVISACHFVVPKKKKQMLDSEGNKKDERRGFGDFSDLSD